MSSTWRLLAFVAILFVAIVCCFAEPALLAAELVRKMREERAEHERLSGELPDFNGRILWILKVVGVVLFIFAAWLFAGLM